MQLKSESIDEPRKHYHLMKRLKKAALYANQLEDVCKNYEKIEEKSLLDVQVINTIFFFFFKVLFFVYLFLLFYYRIFKIHINNL